ncbi:hypothetical protein SAY86_004972 [Trapa natans]|uniref:Uncharacterized protein n=1 Tax=Trapa natans TaxID=22666 RepID=A0AAN7QR10_TRANT|nr:hypothetical protein SAY86_004972 [Trapa natans]
MSVDGGVQISGYIQYFKFYTSIYVVYCYSARKRKLCFVLVWCSWFQVAPLTPNERTGYTSSRHSFLFHIVGVRTERNGNACGSWSHFLFYVYLLHQVSCMP